VRRSNLIAVLSALLLAGCAGDDEEPRTEQPQPLLGVTIGALDHRPNLLGRELRVMAESGVTTLRAPFYWNQAQPVGRMKGGASRLAPLTPLSGRPAEELRQDGPACGRRLPDVNRAPTDRGRDAVVGGPPSPHNSRPADLRAYPACLQTLIGSYGPDGSFWDEHLNVPRQPLRYWQLWNEPDHLRYSSDQPHARDYVRLARAARSAIKDADPGARVVMAGYADRSWDSVAALYCAGAEGVFDVVAIHRYTFEPRNVLRAVQFARRALRQAGDGERPMWLTEVTWSSGRRHGHEPSPFETTPRDHAARLARVFPLLLRKRRALGIQRIYWENWLSTDRDHRDPFNFSGLRILRRDGRFGRSPRSPPSGAWGLG
jgi:hypothetical protein